MFLQLLGDEEILVDDGKAAVEDMSGFGSRHAELAAVADAIELGQVMVNGSEAVVGLAGDLGRLLAFGEALPADDALVSEAGADVVQGGPAGDEALGALFVVDQNVSDFGVSAAE